MKRLPTWGLVPLALAVGCIGEGERVGVPEADFAAFTQDVQPVLSERCANPSCHGSMRRPLAIYAPSFYRADPDATHASDPLTEDELEANFDRSCGFLFDLERPDESQLLSKPLAMSAGGTAHAEVDVFETVDDPEYARILDWVADAWARGEASE